MRHWCGILYSLCLTTLVQAATQYRLYENLVDPTVEACLSQIIRLRDHAGEQLPRGFTATVLTNATLDWKAKRVKYAKCPEGDDVRWFYVGMQGLNAQGVEPHVQLDRGRCSVSRSVAIVYSRPGPKAHFGHRILTDVPSLFALKYFFDFTGQEIYTLPLVLLDGFGPPVSGLEGLESFYNALGHLNVTYQHMEPDTVLCFDKVIFLSTYWHKVWYIDDKGKFNGIWERPDKLMDADPFLFKIVGDVRKQFGLEPELPYAPTNPPKVVLASRNATTRKRLGMHLGRTLENEAELVSGLRAIPSVVVELVEFSEKSLREAILLLGKTSLFLGVHGAAFDNLIFLPRGAFVMEILPFGTSHTALYPARAGSTGKFFVRHIPSIDRQKCSTAACAPHSAIINVDVSNVVTLARSCLDVQKASILLLPADSFATLPVAHNQTKEVQKTMKLRNSYLP